MKTKTGICLLLSVLLLLTLAACGSAKTEPATQSTENSSSAWTREGYFADDKERYLRILHP